MKEDKLIPMKKKWDDINDNIGKYCVQCVSVYVGPTTWIFKLCPQCGAKVYDVKVVIV